MRVALVLLLALPARGAKDDQNDPGIIVQEHGREAFSLPLPALAPAHRAAFFVGNSFFNQNWVAAPASAGSRDGLGPLFNARSCSGCHFKDGRGQPPEPGQAAASLLVRVSVTGQGPHGAPVPDPIYGDQIQGAGVTGVSPEAEVRVTYDTLVRTLPDGETVSLRRPRYRVLSPGYGPPARDLRLSPRVAPAMIGLGLLEAVPARTLEALADPDDRDGDGVSGRVNRVWDVQRRALAVGRFGWKAEQPTVLQQTAAAFLGDMGITSSLFPDENHTRGQRACANRPSGGAPEVSDEILRQVTLYARSLAVPAPRATDEPRVRRGQALFGAAGCAACHVATLRTEAPGDLPELGGRVIHPYTDLLLHDLGPGLADDRPSFAASGREWRTPPLWGLGLVPVVNGHGTLLHDGRARDVTEAVLWHDGEARAARERFERLARADRLALIAFVESL